MKRGFQHHRTSRPVTTYRLGRGEHRKSADFRYSEISGFPAFTIRTDHNLMVEPVACRAIDRTMSLEWCPWRRARLLSALVARIDGVHQSGFTDGRFDIRRRRGQRAWPPTGRGPWPRPRRVLAAWQGSSGTPDSFPLEEIPRPSGRQGGFSSPHGAGEHRSQNTNPTVRPPQTRPQEPFETARGRSRGTAAGVYLRR